MLVINVFVWLPKRLWINPQFVFYLKKNQNPNTYPETRDYKLSYHIRHQTVLWSLLFALDDNSCLTLPIYIYIYKSQGNSKCYQIYRYYNSRSSHMNLLVFWLGFWSLSAAYGIWRRDKMRISESGIMLTSLQQPVWFT